MDRLFILNMLLSGGSAAILPIGLAIGIISGINIKDGKARRAGLIASFAIYVICELLVACVRYRPVGIFAVYIGTIAIGAFLGFIVIAFVNKLNKK